jgi:hypothetical protein
MAEDFDAAEKAGPSQHRVSWRTRLAAGIAAGILATILMMCLMMTYSSMVGERASMPLKALGALVFGVEALVAGPGAMLTGAGIQLGFSLVLGVLFAVAMSVRPSVILALLAGIVVGMAIWLAMELWVLPVGTRRWERGLRSCHGRISSRMCCSGLGSGRRRYSSGPSARHVISVI